MKCRLFKSNIYQSLSIYGKAYDLLVKLLIGVTYFQVDAARPIDEVFEAVKVIFAPFIAEVKFILA